MEKIKVGVVELVQEGFIGEFVGMRIFQSTPRSEMLDIQNHCYPSLLGGMIGETGPHTVCMTQAFLYNIAVIGINAINLSGHSWAKFDEFRIEFVGENGFCSANLSYASNCRAAIIDIVSTDAIIIDLGMLMTAYNMRGLEYKSIAKSSLIDATQIIGGVTSNVFNVIVGKKKIGTELIIEKFIKSVVHDLPVPVSGEEGYKTTEIMEIIVNKWMKNIHNHFPWAR